MDQRKLTLFVRWNCVLFVFLTAGDSPVWEAQMSPSRWWSMRLSAQNITISFHFCGVNKSKVNRFSYFFAETYLFFFPRFYTITIINCLQAASSIGVSLWNNILKVKLRNCISIFHVNWNLCIFWILIVNCFCNWRYWHGIWTAKAMISFDS